MFRDREEAARLLATRLHPYRGQRPLVIAIPRGAVPMAKIIAKELLGEMDVILVRKLRAPHQPELAVGAVDEGGHMHVADFAALYGAEPDYLASEKRAQMETIAQRRAQYTPWHTPVDPRGRIVIVVDDGLATGATMLAALQSVRSKGPARLICAVPVAPQDTLHKVRPWADEVVCLEVPDDFAAVGQFYAHFPQVDDEEVMAILKSA